MSSMLSSSQGVVLATAMAAFSGTVIVFAICRQKTFSVAHYQISQLPPKPCINSHDGKKRVKKEKKKRVHFAEDVVDPTGNGEEFRKQQRYVRDRHRNVNYECRSDYSSELKKSGSAGGRMPANRVALYNGILRDRVVHRLAACSY